MNNLISNPNASTWTRARAQYIAAAAGLALSVAALVGIADSASHRSGSTSPAGHSMAIAPMSNDQQAPEIVFYLVSSQAQADEVQANEELAKWVRFDNGVPEPKRSAVILNAGTADEEKAAVTFVQTEMAASNFPSGAVVPVFQLVDVRSQ